MARGGKREGAGRRQGSQTKRTQEIVAKAAAEGVQPLEFLLSVLRDETADKSERFKAAIEAAPYMHPKLQAVKVSGDEDNPLRVVNEMFGFLNGTGRSLAVDAEDQASADDGAPRMAS